jgi:hypothetical protein
LIGGLHIRVGNYIIDASIKAELVLHSKPNPILTNHYPAGTANNVMKAKTAAKRPIANL